jgi:hypothetical protein
MKQAESESKRVHEEKPKYTCTLRVSENRGTFTARETVNMKDYSKVPTNHK